MPATPANAMRDASSPAAAPVGSGSSSSVAEGVGTRLPVPVLDAVGSTEALPDAVVVCMSVTVLVSVVVEVMVVVVSASPSWAMARTGRAMAERIVENFIVTEGFEEMS